jgi:hypothetical protein
MARPEGTLAGGARGRSATGGLENVGLADWAPDGGSLAVLRERDGRSILEFPIGKEIYSSPFEISYFRVAPDGRSIALIEDGPQGGKITLVESGGGDRVLVEGASYIDSLAWHPSGREVWFSAVDLERGYELRAVVPAHPGSIRADLGSA